MVSEVELAVMVLVLARLMSFFGAFVSDSESEPEEADGGVGARFRVVDFLVPRLKNFTGPFEAGGISWVVVAEREGEVEGIVGVRSDIVAVCAVELELEVRSSCCAWRSVAGSKTRVNIAILEP